MCSQGKFSRIKILNHERYKTVSISDADKASLIDSYNCAALPKFKEIKQKAVQGDTTALTTLQNNWRDKKSMYTSRWSQWTIIVSDEEQESILYKYYTVQAGKKGNRDAIEKLQDIWDAKTVSISDADKASLIDSYNCAALPKFKEIKQKAVQGDTTALTTLQNNWRDKKSMDTSRWSQWTIIVSDEEQESILNSHWTAVAEKAKAGDDSALINIQFYWANYGKIASSTEEQEAIRKGNRAAKNKKK